MFRSLNMALLTNWGLSSFAPSHPGIQAAIDTF
jgi:hypothetical protein